MWNIWSYFVAVQLLSCVQLFVTPWTAACEASLSLTVSQSLLKSCSLSQWCQPTISSSVTCFSSFQPFPPSESFPMSRLFASGDPSIGTSTSASVLPMNSQGWFPLGLTGLIFLQSKGSRESSPTPQFKSVSSLVLSLLRGPILTSIHDYWKNHSFD